MSSFTFDYLTSDNFVLLILYFCFQGVTRLETGRLKGTTICKILISLSEQIFPKISILVEIECHFNDNIDFS